MSSGRTPRQEHAYYEVWKSRQSGQLPNPRGHRCSTPGCENDATETHHADYAKGTVVAYKCASCNRKLGKGRHS